MHISTMCTNAVRNKARTAQCLEHTPSASGMITLRVRVAEAAALERLLVAADMQPQGGSAGSGVGWLVAFEAFQREPHLRHSHAATASKDPKELH